MNKSLSTANNILPYINKEKIGPLPKALESSTSVKLFKGDSVEVLKRLNKESIDLIITSPPYANQRKKTYGGVCAENYVSWFIPIADGLYDVLKSTGSFILNIKECVVKGERHTYVMELIIEMRKRGWIYTEEYIWHKRNCYPGKWPNRFRDAWERCIHFTKQKKFNMYQEAVMVPTGDWKSSRLKKLNTIDYIRDESRVGSGFGKKVDNWINRDMAYPTNVLHLATECGNKGHSAVFPKSLPEWFIKLLTQPNDIVLDPFSGSGTTLDVAYDLSRHAIGIEIKKEYCDIAASKLGLNQVEDGYYKNS